MELSMRHVYLVMQLDSICGTAKFLCLLTGLWCFFALFYTHYQYTMNNGGIKSLIPLGVLASVFVFLLMLCAFLPSSKTAAAMVILPKIANSEMVTKEIPKEISELYTLAKEALVEVTKKKGK
jgi:hypothetical protein